MNNPNELFTTYPQELVKTLYWPLYSAYVLGNDAAASVKLAIKLFKGCGY